MAKQLTVIEGFYEFYKENIDKNLELDFKDFDNVCRGPFRYIKDRMTEGDLEPYRLQYLGTFLIPESRIKYSNSTLDKKLKDGLISQRRYDERKKILSRYEKEKHLG